MAKKSKYLLGIDNTKILPVPEDRKYTFTDKDMSTFTDAHGKFPMPVLIRKVIDGIPYIAYKKALVIQEQYVNLPAQALKMSENHEEWMLQMEDASASIKGTTDLGEHNDEPGQVLHNNPEHTVEAFFTNFSRANLENGSTLLSIGESKKSGEYCYGVHWKFVDFLKKMTIRSADESKEHQKYIRSLSIFDPQNNDKRIGVIAPVVVFHDKKDLIHLNAVVQHFRK